MILSDIPILAVLPLESESEIKQLDSQIQETEAKLNRLLDGYLDQVIEPEIYK